MQRPKNSEGTIALQEARVGSDVETEVLRRYGEGAEAVEAGLCCPQKYDAAALEILPQEIIEKDYGCGDPSAHVRQGETVIDLGSGAGKICYILAQKVGAEGQVIGIDFNDRMLNLARKYQDEMAAKLGCRNVRFEKAKIQDLALSLDRVESWLEEHPIGTVEQVIEFDAYCEQLRNEQPLIASDSVDVIVSNCVLNLVRPRDKEQLFREMHRVLKPGGRVVISDIVCDEHPTEAILNDAELWSGCIAGAFREDLFLEMFEEVGFYGVEILERQDQPWQVIDGIEFRSLTVRAFKGKEGPCLERHQAAVYKGPWKSVQDDDGHTFYRGKRMAVCDKIHKILTRPTGPYADEVLGLDPLHKIELDDAAAFECHGSQIRDPRQMKGMDYRETLQSADEGCCDPGCC